MDEQNRRFNRRFGGYFSDTSGMTMLEMSLAMLFMVMFFAALLAASGAINNMTRGYTCRVLSTDPSSSTPERGCIGQDDEVSVDALNSINLQNRSAIETLKRDLQKYAFLHGGNQALKCLSIKTWMWASSKNKDAACIESLSMPATKESALTVDADLEKDRAYALKNRCLWEKLEPLGNTGKMMAHRNFLEIDYDSSSPLEIVNPTGREVDPLWAVGQERGQGSQKHFWFIRGGRLVGERRVLSFTTGQFSSEPVPGMQGIASELLSVDVRDDSRADGRRPLSEQEAFGENGEPSDQIVFAPDRGWGNINQVCLFQSYGLPNLFLLSGERGLDLIGATSRDGLFGRPVMGGQKLPPLKTLFFVE